MRLLMSEVPLWLRANHDLPIGWRMNGAWCRVSGVGCRVSSVGLRVEGLGFRG